MGSRCHLLASWITVPRLPTSWVVNLPLTGGKPTLSLAEMNAAFTASYVMHVFWLSNATGGPPNTWFVWSKRLQEKAVSLYFRSFGGEIPGLGRTRYNEGTA